MPPLRVSGSPPNSLTAVRDPQAEKPGSLKAAKRRTTERISTRRNRPHGNLQDKSLPFAPKGQPKTAQGEALRFDVREMDPSPERAQQPVQPRPGSPTGVLCRPFRAAARLVHQSTGRCPGAFVGRPLGAEGPHVSASTQRPSLFAAFASSRETSPLQPQDQQVFLTPTSLKTQSRQDR